MFRVILSVLFFASSISFASAHGNNKHKEVSTDSVINKTEVSENIIMLQTKGSGNVGLVIGKDRALLIDGSFDKVAPSLLSFIITLTNKPLKLLVNTHYHFDHAGGNSTIFDTGAVILSHENVRNRLAKEQIIKLFNRKIPATPEEVLPVITISDTARLYVDSKTILAKHYPNAHTDGDIIVHFIQDNVIHTGDLYFAGMYPFIDVDGGGSIRGYISALEEINSFIDGNTKIIPGHGSLSNKKELEETIAMLKSVAANVEVGISRGLSPEQIKAKKPTAEFDSKYGNGFLKPGVFVGIVIDSLLKEKISLSNIYGIWLTISIFS